MRKVFIILLILLIPISFLIFHDKGNEFIKPYLTSYLESKFHGDIDVDVKHLKIDFNHIEFRALINKLAKIDAQGQFSLFLQTLNINYTLYSNTLKNKIDINGTIIGNFSNIHLQGKGEILKSNINYAMNIKDDLYKNIKIQINNADIASFLKLISQPAYARGKADLNVNIPSLEKQSINNTIHIVIHRTKLNPKTFKQELKINLPQETIFTANLNSKVFNKSFQIEGIIESNLATINLSKTNYNTKSKELSSNYILLIPKLSNLIRNSKEELNAKLKIKGTFSSKKSEFNLAGKSSNLGGKTVFNLKDNKLDVHLNDVDIRKLLYLLGKKPYAKGKIIADIHLSDLKKLKGTFNLKTKEAKSISETLRKELNLKFEKNLYFSLDTKGSITANKINMEAELKSEVFQYHSSDIQYSFSTKALKSTYLLHVPKLSRLNKLTGKTLKGKISINGEIQYKDQILITGNTKDLDGNINFILKSDKLNAKINHISVEKLMKVLDYTKMFKATLIGDLQYNLTTKKGRLGSTLNQVQLLNTYLIKVISNIKGTDLSSEYYHQTHFNAALNKNLLHIDFKAKGNMLLLSIPVGQIDTLTNKINAYYKIKIENKELEGRIKGDISDPKITLNSSKYLQNNMMNIIEENINKGIIEEFDMAKEERNVFKSMMGGFF